MTVFGTAVIAGQVLHIVDVVLRNGRITFTAVTPLPVSRTIRIAPGDLVHVHGADGTTVATFRLPGTTTAVTVKRGWTCTVFLPVAIHDFVGDAEWPQLEALCDR